MKGEFMKKSLLALNALILGLTFLSPAVSLRAQDDLLENSSDEQFNLDELNINGKQKKSAADKLEEMRKKLEEQNEQMVQKKIEDARIKSEQKLTEQLQDAFNQGLNNDSVSTSVASVQKVEVEAPAEVKKAEKKIRIIPGLGILNVKSNDVDFESKVSGNMAIESDINKNFSAGANFRYATMEVTDLGSNNNVNNNYGGNYNYFYNPTYFNYYGQQGRELNYKHMGLDLFGKFYILSEKVRPYVGLAMGYNRDSLKYENSNAFSVNGYNTGNEQFNTSFISGSAMLGTIVNFTETIGMNAEFSYIKGLSSGIKSNAQSFSFVNPDQDHLNKIGNSIVNANFYSLNIGLVISF